MWLTHVLRVVGVAAAAGAVHMAPPALLGLTLLVMIGLLTSMFVETPDES